jgi:pimeloyl-ACP methyl ester carboxylesterase
MHQDTRTTRSERIRWAGLAGRRQGDRGPGLVLLHGLTFDRRMWDPLLDVLPDDLLALAFDLPGHGGSPAVDGSGLAPVVDALHAAVTETGVEAPIVVGHSIGGPIAAIYASTYPASAVVSIDAPLRLEPFADELRALRPILTGDRFADVWATFRESWGMGRVPPAQRELLRAGDGAPQALVLRYQADILDRPAAALVRWRDDGLRRLREAGTPYVSIHAGPVPAAERAWITDRLPQARVLEWPADNHFPHMVYAERLAALLDDLAGV